MTRNLKRKSSAKRLPLETKTKLVKRNASKIQLVPVINPRVLYYLGRLSEQEYFFDIPELNGLTIPEPLLDICVGILADDSLVSDKVKSIPVTTIPDIMGHLELAFEQLPKFEFEIIIKILRFLANVWFTNRLSFHFANYFKLCPTHMDFYSAMINIKFTGVDVWSNLSNVSVNWILYNIIWDDNDRWLLWENYWDEFNNNWTPELSNVKICAEKVIGSPFFKAFVKEYPHFMTTKLCNVRSAVLLSCLYQNPERCIDPYDCGGQAQFKIVFPGI